MEKIELRGDYIKLGQALKAANLVENGGAAKDYILEGYVRVNGEVCTMRGKKLYKGDKVSFDGEEIEIV